MVGLPLRTSGLLLQVRLSQPGWVLGGFPYQTPGAHGSVRIVSTSPTPSGCSSSFSPLPTSLIVQDLAVPHVPTRWREPLTLDTCPLEAQGFKSLGNEPKPVCPHVLRILGSQEPSWSWTSRKARITSRGRPTGSGHRDFQASLLGLDSASPGPPPRGQGDFLASLWATSNHRSEG